ncbi:MAG: 6-phosphogluconolactonase [Acidimicrobiia bacterium]
MRGEVRVVDHVPQAFAELVAGEAPRSIALSGGDTARRCYELLDVAPVEWRETDVFFGDERWVPVDDPDSNEGMASHAFLDNVLPRSVHSLRHAGETIEEAARSYDALLRRSEPVELVHLGVGPDGHTASLFPESPALAVADRFVVATGDDRHPHPRLTWTYPAIGRCPLVVFTVEGAAKRAVFEQLVAGAELPAARVEAPRVVWLVDRAAAAAGV